MARRPLLLAVAATALGCSEPAPYELEEEEVRHYAEARCAAAERCCAQTVPADCSESIVAATLGFGGTVDAELSYSAECMDQLQAFAEDISCDPQEQGWEGCRLAVGRGSHGDRCEIYSDAVGFDMVTCARGLQCRAGHCVDDPFVTTQRGREGELCSPFAPCDSALFCGTAGVCAPRPRPGEACFVVRSCEREYYCAGLPDGGEGICEPQLGQGQACDERYDNQCGRDDIDGDQTLTFCIEGVCSPIDSPVCEAV